MAWIQREKLTDKKKLDFPTVKRKEIFSYAATESGKWIGYSAKEKPQQVKA